MRFPPSLLDEIRNRLPLSQVVGRRVAWDKRKSRPARGDFWACCPFHGEKSPSFHVEDGKGRYHCFGCGVSGDHFRFLTEKEGLSFPEAVERLAAEAGVPLPEASPEAEARERERAGLHEILEMACRFFEITLEQKVGAAARAYLARRRIGPELQRRFRIGYAPGERNALKEHLAAANASLPMMIEAGLLVSGEDIPVAFDRFRDRIIFPIADLRGRVVGFGGRALSAEAQAKYLNSPETPLFRKGELLYNLAEARKAVRAGTLIVVEGYVDVIALAGAGFGHAVAPLGTALTDRQLELLWRVTPEPILCFDGDEAGLRAAQRAVELALPMLGPGRTLRFALLPAGQDPDDLIGAGGAEAMRAVLEAARPMVEMIWARETEGRVFDTPERRAALEARLREIAGSVGDADLRRHYQQALGERVAAFLAPAARPAREGRQGWRGGQGGRGGGRFADRPPPPLVVSEALRRSVAGRGGPLPPMREVVLVMTLANHPALIARHCDEFAAVDLSDRPLDSLRRRIIDIAALHPDIDAAGLRGRLAPAEAVLAARLDEAVARSRHWQVAAAAADQDAEEGWMQALTLQRKARTLHKDLKEAEAALADEPSEAAVARIVDIKSQLASAEGTEALIEGFGAPSGRGGRGL